MPNCPLQVALVVASLECPPNLVIESPTGLRHRRGGVHLLRWLCARGRLKGGFSDGLCPGWGGAPTQVALCPGDASREGSQVAIARGNLACVPSRCVAQLLGKGVALERLCPLQLKGVVCGSGIVWQVAQSQGSRRGRQGREVG